MVYQAVIRPEYELLKIRNSSYNFPVHFHKRICIGKVISGEKCIEINNCENKVSKNGIYIIPPYTAHSCEANGNSDYIIFSFDISGINNLEILSKGAKYLEMDLHEIAELTKSAHNNIFFL
jgi:gentisate 1,2-dioxygenase